MSIAYLNEKLWFRYQIIKKRFKRTRDCKNILTYVEACPRKHQKKNMLIVVLLSIVTTVLAGTECPPRENIYPCSCVAVPQGRNKFFTTVTCHRLGTSDDLAAILPSLRSMAIDHFYLYDSFWEANKLEDHLRENKQVLPTDWMTILKIKEIEIVDTTLSSCFACQSKVTCRNSVTTRFTAVNSSSHEKICTLCDSTADRKFSWTGCLSKLRIFHFRNNELSTVRADLFPVAMRELVELDLSHNRISKIESKAFQNTPRLKKLDLSNNALQSLDAMITGQSLPYLEELDVSWNLIKIIGKDLFRGINGLRAFKASNNMITDLNEEEWAAVNNDKLRHIDLRENPLNCDCSILWVNSTFRVHVEILGHCATPADYEDSVIRKVSRLLGSRCSGGTMGTRARTTKRPVTKSMFVF